MGSGLGAARAESFQPVVLSPDIRHATHLLAVGPLFTLVLTLFLFLLVPTLVTLTAIYAVNKGPLGCLVGTEVVVLTKRFSEPPVQLRIPLLGGEHPPDQSPIKVPRHGLQQVTMARHVKPLEVDDPLAFGAPG